MRLDVLNDTGVDSALEALCVSGELVVAALNAVASGHVSGITARALAVPVRLGQLRLDGLILRCVTS